MRRAPLPASLTAQLLLAIAACAFAHLLHLGDAGLRDTEGHRAIPGWTILATGDWLPTRMFDAVYIRKPPGMPWAVALSSSLLGPTELAARLPSALAACALTIATLLFARRWFGARWALPAALAAALLPLFQPVARTAEIESLNNLATALAAFALIDLLVHQPRWPACRRARAAGMTALAAVGVAGTILMKGPASAPVLLAAIAAACAVRGWSRALDPRLWAALALAAALTAAWAIPALLALRSEPPGAPPPVADKVVWWHLWRSEHIPGILLLVPLAFLAAMPASLAVLFPFGPDARREATIGPESPHRIDPAAHAVARALAWAFVLALVLYALVGVHNVRYTMPAAVLAPPLAAYVARGWAANFTPARRAIARLCSLGHPAVLLAVLLAVAAAWTWAIEPRRAATSGRLAADALADALPDNAELWADGLIEARPETLWYAQRRAEQQGRQLRVLWRKDPGVNGAPDVVRVPPPGAFAVLTSPERDAWERSGALDHADTIHHGRVHQYDFTLVRVR